MEDIVVLQDCQNINNIVPQLMNVRKLHLLGATPITLDSIRTLTNLTDLLLEPGIYGISYDDALECVPDKMPHLKTLLFKVGNEVIGWDGNQKLPFIDYKRPNC